MAQKGWALSYAAEELKADKDVVLAAVKVDSRALKQASAEMQADPKVVLAAAAQAHAVCES